MEKVMVSIICNTYNHENYIRETLEGFLAQKTNYRFEILVHDDASTDRTAAIIEQYQIRYPEIIKPVFQKQNQYSKGHDIVLQFQAPRAKGKYIAFCEGDDYWCDSNKLELQITFLETHPEYSGSVHNTQYINDAGIRQNTCVSNEKDDMDITTMDSMLSFPHTSSYLFRNPWHKTTPASEYLIKYLSPWDKSYAIYMIKCGKVRYFANIMSCYRYVDKKGTSFQTRKRLENLTKSIVDAELAHYRQIKAYDLDIDIMPHYFRNACSYALKKYIMQPSKKNLELLKYSFMKSPYTKTQYFQYCFMQLPRTIVAFPKKLFKKATKILRKQ